MLRTHTCGELRAGDVNEEETVTLCGWVDSYRDHGGLVFIDLRDRYGKTQIVFNPEEQSEIHDTARGLRSEDVIQISGIVRHRGEGLTNPKLETGEIELRARELIIHNKSKTLPFEPSTNELPNEELRLKYRFIDLRRPALQRAMKLRHKISKANPQILRWGRISSKSKLPCWGEVHPKVREIILFPAACTKVVSTRFRSRHKSTSRF